MEQKVVPNLQTTKTQPHTFMKPHTFIKTATQKSVSSFGKDGLYRLEYPAELRAAVQKTVEAWKEFCALPQEVKAQFPYANGVGFEHKTGGGATDDIKDDFHFTEDGSSFLHSSVKKVKTPQLKEAAAKLLEASQLLVYRLQALVMVFTDALEVQFGMKDLMNETLASQGTWFVRLLYYPGDRKVGENIGMPHIDKSAFTLHLYESDPGLQGLTYADKKWVDTPVSDHDTVIFPGFQMQYRSKGKIKALCHRVVSNETTSKAGRYSMVCFFSLKNTPKYNKDSIGRLQDQAPGFNYDIGFDEVEKMFK